MTTKRAFWLPCECRWLPPLEASQRPRQRPQCRAGPSCWLRADNLAQLPRHRRDDGAGGLFVVAHQSSFQLRVSASHGARSTRTIFHRRTVEFPTP
jgi:hypothetical protein